MSIKYKKNDKHPGRSHIADLDEYRREVSKLKARLVQETRRGGVRIISVFGMGPGVGVTTLTVSFAREMAERGEPVVLVDGNVSAPSIHEKLGIELKPGAAEVLRSPDEVGRALRSFPEENLSVLTCGEWPHPNAATLDWRGLFEGLCADGRVVLVDAGVESAPDAAGIATASDGVILVVEAGKSRWEQVASFSDRMRSMSVNVLGAVINKRRFPIPEFIYRDL